MENKELFQIALKYVNKSYSYENLKDGDDLYNATSEEKEKCLSFYDDIQEQGNEWAESKLSEFDIDYSEIVFLDENSNLLRKIANVFDDIKNNSTPYSTQAHAKLNMYLRSALNQSRIIRDCL